MKIFFKLLIVGIFATINFSNTSGVENLSLEKVNKNNHNFDNESLMKTYGFLKGQQFTLDKIEKKYPDLKIEVKRCQLEFNLAFRKANDEIFFLIKDALGDNNFEEYEKEFTKELNKLMLSQELTKTFALNFIEEVSQRSKGKIPSPILEILLIYQYSDAPENEFIDGFKVKYSTKKHYKAKGIDVQIEVPQSWKIEEADRPNIIQRFTSENGSGGETILIMIQNLNLPNNYVLTKEELNDFFSENELKKIIPEGGEYISSKKISLDGQIGGQLIFKLKRERLDFSMTTQNIYYITIYNGKLIFLQCTVIEDKGNLSEKFQRVSPLFRQIANSFILMNQY